MKIMEQTTIIITSQVNIIIIDCLYSTFFDIKNHNESMINDYPTINSLGDGVSSAFGTPPLKRSS